jgi:uncharacterized protein YndB with AHSA1/START domain
MSATTPVGRVVRDADGALLVYDRTLDAPVDRVWAAVTAPDELERWFGRWTGDPASGEVALVMTAEGQTEPERVTVSACEPPTHLAVVTQGPDGPWPLELVLTADAGGTRLRFTHRLAEPYDASSTGPGWQYYLDRLEAVVAGTPVPDDFDAYHPALAAAYAVPPA